MRRQIGPDPRVLPDDLWPKLLWAGLNLTVEDVVTGVGLRAKAIAAPGCSIPLRWCEPSRSTGRSLGYAPTKIRRLRVGAVRWQHEDVRIAGSDEVLSKNAVCFLSIPVNKTSPAFTKPVDRPVGRLSPHGRRSVRISHCSPIERLASWWTCYSRTADG